MNKLLNVFKDILNFHNELSSVGKIVLFIAVILFIILLVLIAIMYFQKSVIKKESKILLEDEKALENISKLDTIKIDESNENTKNLKDIVNKLKEYEKKSVSDYEDEQEKTAVISCKELFEIKEKVNEDKVVGESETFLQSLKEFRNNL